MLTIKSKKELQAHIEILRKSGKKIAFVPTMGALHDGHLSLVDIARKHADAVVMSIFVNPTQFGPKEDFNKYPRDEKKDLAKLKKSKVDVVYFPSVAEIYPGGTKSDIKVPKNITSILCGKFRPGHFDGVATVVKRLFEHVKPDVAVFGEKDFQQLHVIRWLVKKYKLPVKIIGAPIMREKDGLAMSSRNAYLSTKERTLAPELYRILQFIKKQLPLEGGAGESKRTRSSNRGGDSLSLLGRGRGEGSLISEYNTEIIHLRQGFGRQAPPRIAYGSAAPPSRGSDVFAQLSKKGFKLDYLEIRDEKTLKLTKDFTKPCRIFVAGYLGKTRLIDNLKIN